MVRIFILITSLSVGVHAQILDFGTAIKLTANINSEGEELLPLLTPDGRTIYFSRAMYAENIGGVYAGLDTWMSRYDVTIKDWGKASNSRMNVNTKANNTIIGTNKKGDIVYLLNSTSAKSPKGIYVVKKNVESWSEPELIPIPGLHSESFMGAYVSPDLDVIFLSMNAAGGKGEEDLFVTLKGSTGEWSYPRNIGSSINTPGFEISPFLSADKNRLYFSSNGHGGLGDADIFYSDRLYNSWDTWTAPRTLGSKINTKGFDAYFSIYGDTIAYFTSNRDSKFSDIYSVKVMPGNEVLAFGQHYLTNEEVGILIGPLVSRRLTFEKNAIELNSAQRELLWFIANKIVQKRDISIQISVMDEETPVNSAKRAIAIAEHLKLAGIESARIVLPEELSTKKINTTTSGVIDILFFQ